MKRYRLVALLFCLSRFSFAQDESLLDILGQDPVVEYVTNAFKSPRVINNHSMEMLAAGALDYRILHRFGQLDEGLENLFGLDNATMRMSFDYGISKNFTIGIGRSSTRKELDGYIKYRILHQSRGAKVVPLSLIWVSGMTLNTQRDPFPEDTSDVKFSERLAYFNQIILGRKFTEKFTMQISPTLLHQNVVDYDIQPNNLFALGIGLRYKLTQRVALVADYSFVLNRVPASYQAHPLSLGVDIETGGHVFQLHFSNATGMNERAFLSEPNGDWFRGNFRFGFNLSRVFQIKRKKLLE